jgi:hypothetical protein
MSSQSLFLQELQSIPIAGIFKIISRALGSHWFAPTQPASLSRLAGRAARIHDNVGIFSGSGSFVSLVL